MYIKNLLFSFVLLATYNLHAVKSSYIQASYVNYLEKAKQDPRHTINLKKEPKSLVQYSIQATKNADSKPQ